MKKPEMFGIRQGQDRKENKTKIVVDHRLSKNQLVRFPVVSCDWTPATAELGALLSDPPPPRSGFAILDPAKLNPPLPSMVGSPLVEPCFAASSLSLTAVNCASNLVMVSMTRQNRTKGNKDIPVIGLGEFLLAFL